MARSGVGGRRGPRPRGRRAAGRPARRRAAPGRPRRAVAPRGPGPGDARARPGAGGEPHGHQCGVRPAGGRGLAGRSARVGDGGDGGAPGPSRRCRSRSRCPSRCQRSVDACTQWQESPVVDRPPPRRPLPRGARRRGVAPGLAPRRRPRPGGAPRARGLGRLPRRRRRAPAAPSWGHRRPRRGPRHGRDDRGLRRGPRRAGRGAWAAAARRDRGPGYRRAVGVGRAAGHEVVGLAVDAEGLVVDAVPSGLDLVYASPAHQYPLGGRLPVARRGELARRARAEGFVVVEDDYDGELRYDVAPLPVLAALAPDVVVHLGTASKIATPTLGRRLDGGPAAAARGRARRPAGDRDPAGARRPGGAGGLGRRRGARPAPRAAAARARGPAGARRGCGRRGRARRRRGPGGRAPRGAAGLGRRRGGGRGPGRGGRAARRRAGRAPHASGRPGGAHPPRRARRLGRAAARELVDALARWRAVLAEVPGTPRGDGVGSA